VVYKFKKSYMHIYMYNIWVYVKHNSSMGTHIEILELLTNLLLFRAGSLGDKGKSLTILYKVYFRYFCKNFQDYKLPERAA